MGKGTTGERKVANWFEDEQGWYAQRTGTSGGATDRNRPDIIACTVTSKNIPRVLMIELKTTDPPVRFGKDEVKELEEAAERGGAEPLIVVNPDLRKYDQRYAVAPQSLKENRKSYTFYPEKCDWQALESVV